MTCVQLRPLRKVTLYNKTWNVLRRKKERQKKKKIVKAWRKLGEVVQDISSSDFELFQERALGRAGNYRFQLCDDLASAAFTSTYKTFENNPHSALFPLVNYSPQSTDE